LLDSDVLSCEPGVDLKVSSFFLEESWRGDELLWCGGRVGEREKIGMLGDGGNAKGETMPLFCIGNASEKHAWKIKTAV
jgi:hypothetical protein